MSFGVTVIIGGKRCSTCSWANKLCQFLHEATPDPSSEVLDDAAISF
jgi:hypothetical protein